jgi:hypothetical protein
MVQHVVILARFIKAVAAASNAITISYVGGDFWKLSKCTFCSCQLKKDTEKEFLHLAVLWILLSLFETRLLLYPLIFLDIAATVI